MPVSVLERDELGAADAGDRPAAGVAAFGEELTEAVGAVGLIVAAGEASACQTCLAVRASETLPMPWLVLVGHATAGDHLVALDATSCVLFLVTLGAVDLLFAWDEALGADRRFAHHAAEALLVPLPSLVLHLLGTSPEDFAATIAPGGELLVVAFSAVNAIRSGTELLID